jgi:hypothetical protein
MSDEIDYYIYDPLVKIGSKPYRYYVTTVYKSGDRSSAVLDISNYINKEIPLIECSVVSMRDFENQKTKFCKML